LETGETVAIKKVLQDKRYKTIEEGWKQTKGTAVLWNKNYLMLEPKYHVNTTATSISALAD
jgi:hypothetical protein